MPTYIALLRGINVGGHKKLKMADLKQMMEGLGFQNVTTYIQSGNVIFSSTDEQGVSEKISKEIANRFSYEVPVIVKSRDQISQILKDCPFEEEKKIKSYFMLLASPPKSEFTEAFNEINYLNEEFVVTANCVYIHFGNGIGTSKLNNNFFEKKLEVTATTRNYRTLAKLVELGG